MVTKCAINSCDEMAIASIPIMEYKQAGVKQPKLLTIPLCKIHLNMYERRIKKK